MVLSSCSLYDDVGSCRINNRPTSLLQIDAERIIPFLRETGLVSAEDVDVIRRQPSPAQRIHTLLGILPAKGFQAFQVSSEAYLLNIRI